VWSATHPAGATLTIGRLLESGSAALRRLSTERALLVFQSVLAALAITPFGLWRVSHGEWAQGLFDLGLVVLLLTMAWVARIERWARPLARAVSILYIASSLVIAYRFGVLGQFWFFPAVVATFFVVRAGEALMLSLAGLAAHLWILTTRWSSDTEAMTFLATSLLVCVFIHAFASRLRFDNSRLYRDSTVDSLTGAANRRQLDDALASQAHQAPAGGWTMLMIDVDHFKSVNDRFGHPTGDLCLQRLAARVTQRIGPTRTLYRAGGEEFVVLGAMSLDEGTALAEMLRADIEGTPLIREDRVTVSIGVASRRPGESTRDWLRRADDAMYAAKRDGRNRVRTCP
jgi:diguanylate cyclase (GGDEF)-like protein